MAPALRSTGSLTNRGRVAPVRDPTLARASRQREQAVALAAQLALQTSLLTGGEVRLSTLSPLSPDGFAELLTLLGTALATPVGTDGRRRALSVDGQVEVTLRSPATSDR